MMTHPTLSTTNLLFGDHFAARHRDPRHASKDTAKPSQRQSAVASPTSDCTSWFDEVSIVDDHHNINDNDSSATLASTPPQPSWLAYVFGFLYEETDPDEDDEILKPHHEYDHKRLLWNPLHVALFCAYALSTAATSVPVALAPFLSEEFSALSESNSNYNYGYNDAGDTNNSSNNNASFAPRMTAFAVLGCACGKLMLSPWGDVIGARRTAVLAAWGLSLSLIALASSQTATAACWACGSMEFWHAVMWPCIVVVLATHHRTRGHAVYEGGIFVTSLASRAGSLVGIPLASYGLLHVTNWRWMALGGAWAAAVASSIWYLLVMDAPHAVNQPANPVGPDHPWTTAVRQAWQQQQQPALSQSRRPPHQSHHFGGARNWTRPVLWPLLLGLVSLIQTHLVPSLRHVLRSGTFWIVALAHTGSSCVRTSERILGTYYKDTSRGTLSENRAGGLAVFLSIGTILGLVIAGGCWYSRPSNSERRRKLLVMRLYGATIVACYVLAFLSLPILPPDLNLVGQVMATVVLGFGIAVPLYHIPSLVGATFGCDKGLYAGYTDGVAYLLSSLVWRMVSHVVAQQETGNNDEQQQTNSLRAYYYNVLVEGNNVGWAYGWAAVALILIISATLMAEFMEYYFVRPSARHAEGYETILFA